MNTYSVEAGTYHVGTPAGGAMLMLLTRLYPLVRASRVLWSGLTTVVTAWLASQPCPARKAGSYGSSGSIGANREPWGASGVICWPILGRAWTLDSVGRTWISGCCASASAPEMPNESVGPAAESGKRS